MGYFDKIGRFAEKHPFITAGGMMALIFGGLAVNEYSNSKMPKTEPNALPAPCGGNPVCGLVCAGECVPGE